MSLFPPRLSRGGDGDGDYLLLEDSRLLLASRKPTTPEKLTGPLKKAGLMLEDAGEEPAGRRTHRVNHTDTRFWVRSADRGPIDDRRLRTIRKVLGGVLVWIGPVYRVGGTADRQGRESMLCPLPHVLLVREGRGSGRPLRPALRQGRRQ